MFSTDQLAKVVQVLMEISGCVYFVKLLKFILLSRKRNLTSLSQEGHQSRVPEYD